MLRCVEAEHSHYVRERGDGAAGAWRVSLAPGNGGLTLRPVEVAEYGRTEGVAERILAAAAYAPEARAEHEAREAAKAAKAAEQAARDAEARIRHREHEEAKEAAREAAKAARQAAKIAWIAQHGSERLRLAVDLVGIDKVNGIYLDERIGHLHAVSGLQWERDVEESSHDEPLNPSLEALRLCQRVRESAAEWGSRARPPTISRIWSSCGTAGSTARRSASWPCSTACGCSWPRADPRPRPVASAAGRGFR